MGNRTIEDRVMELEDTVAALVRRVGLLEDRPVEVKKVYRRRKVKKVVKPKEPVSTEQ